MNLAEFKAWLEGYSASFADGVPSKEQWAEVSKRLADVEPLTFAPYGPRLPDTMTRPWNPVVGPLTGDGTYYWQNPVVSSCGGVQ